MQHDYKISGLSSTEVATRNNAGLTNHTVDSVSPSYFWIIIRNFFNLINLFIVPLLLLLLYLGIYKEVFVFSTFAIINSILSIFDEIRIKRRLDQIKIEFAKKVQVIRDGKNQEIPADQLVEDDCVIVTEGESISTDGTILYANYLQVDESLLTGESNYITKEESESVLAGSFVVTGECVYQVTKVGAGNYVNLLSAESKTFRKERSNLQKIGDKLTIFFVISAIIFGFVAYFSANSLGYTFQQSLFPLLTAVALIIPQTLIFLFTFTFSISVLKLSKLGALVQRGSAIESLANLDVLCLDKTGTITTNEMHIVDAKYWHIQEQKVAGAFNFAAEQLYGKNKTLLALTEYFERYPAIKANDLNQVPFTSKTKITKVQITGRRFTYLYFGAASVISDYLGELKLQVLDFVKTTESQGKRVIVGIYHESETPINLKENFAAQAAWAAIINEDLNPAIEQTLRKFQSLGTELKIISGDSMLSVQKVLGRVGLQDLPAVDLSTYEHGIAEAAGEFSVFTRAKPEDKLSIVRALQAQGKSVGMVGDGVNDVLALKLANLSIAMSNGAKVARDVADVVLLNNDFSLVPKIMFEGENIIANLKYMNKLFLMKTFHAIFFVMLCAMAGLIVPLLPSSLLVYSFFGTSLPSYVIAFIRRQVVSSTKRFWSEVMPFGIISALVSAFASMQIYNQLLHVDIKVANTAIVYGAFVFTIYLVLEQLYENKYVTDFWKLPLIGIALLIAGVIPMFIPFLNMYYDIIPLSNEVWQLILVNATIAFGVYLLLSFIYKLLPVFKQDEVRQ